MPNSTARELDNTPACFATTITEPGVGVIPFGRAPPGGIAREAKRALESHYAEFLSDTIVRQCTDFARASSDGLPINAYAPSSKGARDIDALINEMMSARFERAMERSA